MVNQAFRIKIAYRSKEKKKKEKIPGIGRYPMGPTKTLLHDGGQLANTCGLVGNIWQFFMFHQAGGPLSEETEIFIKTNPKTFLTRLFKINTTIF